MRFGLGPEPEYIEYITYILTYSAADNTMISDSISDDDHVNTVTDDMDTYDNVDVHVYIHGHDSL